MHGSTTDEKVSYDIVIEDREPVCKVTVESPRVADLDPASEGIIDALEALAWSIDQTKMRQSRTDLMQRMNSDMLLGWGTTRFTGYVTTP